MLTSFSVRSAVALVLLGAVAAAQTITVTTLEDDTDFAAPQTVAQLPGPDGRVSFREACLAANNTSGPQTIAFAIPKAQWTDPKLALLKLQHGVFVLDDDGTTVDFTTQTAFTGDTNPAGHEVGIFGLEAGGSLATALLVRGDGCAVLGLDRVQQRGVGVQISGSHNRITGCTISGPLVADVQVNGLDGVPAADNRIGGLAPGEGNVLSGAGRFSSEGLPLGSQLLILDATGTIVEGNFIGTTPDGLAAAQQLGPNGIELAPGASGTLVRGNLISGLVANGDKHFEGQVFGSGLLLNAPGPGNIIQGNRIGTDASGAVALPNLVGVRDTGFVSGSPLTNTLLGGTAAGQGNTIAFNLLEGVRLSGATEGVRISGNSIHSNGAQGIDLLPAGPTPNDPGDVDTGPNSLQNVPALLGVKTVGFATAVQGVLDTLAGEAFSVEFFDSPVADFTGYGEGRDFLGAVTVQTNAAGHAEFATQLPVSVAEGHFVTATATQLATGNTSEFSFAVQVATWSKLGLGKAGIFGPPALAGSGPLTAGSSNVLTLTGANPSSAATLVVGVEALGAPFKGGTMVPDPKLLLGFATDAAGTVTVPFTWPAGVPAGTQLYLQFWVADVFGFPGGLSASNGLVGTTP